MELKQFINLLQQNPALRAVVPMNQGMLYPRFAVQGDVLCVHFLTNASNITPEGMLMHTPAYHIAAQYPGGRLLCVESLRCRPDLQDVDFSAVTLLPKPDAEQKPVLRERLHRLTALVNGVFSRWDETATADPEEYHTLLEQVLTAEQAALYRRILELD